MADQNSSYVPVATNVQKIDAANDQFDMEAMKEFSLDETDTIEKANQGQGDHVNPNKRKQVAEDEDEEEIEEDDSDSEDDLSEDDDGEEGDSEGEDDDAEDSDSEDEEETDEAIDDKKSIVAKAGEKEIKIPKNAKISLKINGKVEQLPLQEVINKASGAVNLERETSNLGREKKKFEAERDSHKKKWSDLQQNIEFINEITSEGTLEDICEFVGAQQGKEPSQVMTELLQKVEGYVTQFEGMTEREKTLYNENRKYKFAKKREAKLAEAAKRNSTMETEIADVRKELASHGLTDEDWIAEAEEIQQLIKSGELDEEPDAFEIVDRAVQRKSKANVINAISSVSKNLATNDKFVTKVLKAVASAEQLTGEKFSSKELQKLVSTVVGQKKNGLSESLSRKVDKANKAGKTNSKNASSRKQGKQSAMTLRDHQNRMAGYED